MPRIDTDIKLDFKDVLFRPKRSTIRSRSDVSIFLATGQFHGVGRTFQTLFQVYGIHCIVG